MCEADLSSADQVVIFKGDFACLQAINLTNSTTGDLVFMSGTKFLPVGVSFQQNVMRWNSLLSNNFKIFEFVNHPSDVIFQSVCNRLFHRTTFCWEDTPTGKNLVPPMNTRSLVVELVKLMACRQAKSPLKITTWSAEERSASHIYWQLTNSDIHKCLCLPPSHQFD